MRRDTAPQAQRNHGNEPLDERRVLYGDCLRRLIVVRFGRGARGVGRRVLVVDLDPLQTLTEAFDLLADPGRAGAEAIVEVAPRVGLIPTSAALADLTWRRAWDARTRRAHSPSASVGAAVLSRLPSTAPGEDVSAGTASRHVARPIAPRAKSRSPTSPQKAA